MSLEIRLLSYKGNGTQGERIVRTTFRGKIEFTLRYTRQTNNCPYFRYIYQNKYIGLYAFSRPKSNLDTRHLTFRFTF